MGNLFKNQPTGLIQAVCHLSLFGIVAFFAGCSKRYSDLPAYWPVPFNEADNQSVGRFKTSFIADQIDTFYRGVDPGPIGVTTLVNLDDLYSTSPFGRMYSEQLISELAMKSYDVVELRHADALQFLSTSGEFGLSRDTAAIKTSRNLGGIIVGTYSVSPDRVYINVRLVDPRSSMVLSAGSVEIDKTSEIKKMLKGGSGGGTQSLERIPVKHIGYATYPAYMFPMVEERHAFVASSHEEEEEVRPPVPSLKRSK